MKRSNWGRYPTNEDLLDINFHAIVSDCRGILSGTLTPRPWADISSTWFDDDSASRNHQMHRTVETRANVSKAAKQAWTRRERGPSSRIKALHTQMVRTLQSGGMDFKTAHDKARELLGIK